MMFPENGLWFLKVLAEITIVEWFAYKLSSKIGAEKQASCSTDFHGRSYICKNFPGTKDIGQNSAYTGIVNSDSFIREHKVIFYKQTFSMLCRSAPSISRYFSKIIQDRIASCIPNQIEIWIFVNDGNKIFLHIE